MFEQECIPFAPSLIESMRSLGYSFSSAISDLIDNSISAGATRIDILSDPSSNPELFLIDNGCGMDKETLYEAMRYGSRNPLEKRDENDLGRFGLGLKAASLSQCRKLVVVSKQDDNIASYSWDLDYVQEKGKWLLKGFTKEEILNLPKIEELIKLKSGTYIYLSEFDRIKEGTANISSSFSKRMDELGDHLSLVFHRFINEDGLQIIKNRIQIEERDPFLVNNPRTQKKREKVINIDGEEIIAKPYILPTQSKLNSEDYKLLGGEERLRTDQGFYIYRNRRLIIWGTWFRLERRHELKKLARIRVDIPNSLDYMWSIDVKKSSAVLPDKIKENLSSEVLSAVQASESVARYRGRSDNGDNVNEYVWERIKKREGEGYQYLINKKIPQIQALEDTLDDEQVKMLDLLLKRIEDCFPAAAFYYDVGIGRVADEEGSQNQETIDKLWADLEANIAYIKSNELPLNKYINAFIKTEPFCKYQEIIEKLKQELANNE